MKKKHLILLSVTLSIALIGFISGYSSASQSRFLMGSPISKVYHWSNCRYAKQIMANDELRRKEISEKTSELIDEIPKGYLRYKSPEEAIIYGKRPCKVCQPPIKIKEE